MLVGYYTYEVCVTGSRVFSLAKKLQATRRAERREMSASSQDSLGDETERTKLAIEISMLPRDECMDVSHQALLESQREAVLRGDPATPQRTREAVKLENTPEKSSRGKKRSHGGETPAQIPKGDGSQSEPLEVGLDDESPTLASCGASV